MKWIKAKNKLPEEEWHGPIRHRYDEKYKVWEYDSSGSREIQNNIENYPDVEWLDESLPASLEDEAKALYPTCNGSQPSLNERQVARQEAHITCARMYLSRLAEKDGEIEGLKAELQAIKEEHDFRNKPLM